MNSFCHYAFGSVGQWMYRHILGIQPSEDVPGFRRFIIRPLPGGGLTWAAGSHDCINGRIETRWTLSDGEYRLEMTVPPNTSATVWVRADDPAAVKPEPARECGDRTEREGFALFEVGSGAYRFTAPLASKESSRSSAE